MAAYLSHRMEQHDQASKYAGEAVHHEKLIYGSDSQEYAERYLELKS